MASKTAEDAIIAFFDAQYASVGGTWTRFDLDNNLPNIKDPSIARFWSIDFPPVGREERKSFGNPGSNRFEEDGTVQFHFFVREGTGSALAKTEADKLRNAVRVKLFSNVIIDYVGPPEGDPDTRVGSWYSVTVAVDFRYSTYH